MVLDRVCVKRPIWMAEEDEEQHQNGEREKKKKFIFIFIFYFFMFLIIRKNKNFLEMHLSYQSIIFRNKILLHCI